MCFFLVIFVLFKVKQETPDPAAKKRKTEWSSGLSKLQGDVSFVKDGMRGCSYQTK